MLAQNISMEDRMRLVPIWLSTTINIRRSARRTSVVIEMQIYDSTSFIYDVLG